MTWKPVVYRDHAARRLRQRRIRRAEVRALLATGVRVAQGKTRWRVDGTLGGHAARLVLHEAARQSTVITVMWLGYDADAEGRP